MQSSLLMTRLLIVLLKIKIEALIFSILIYYESVNGTITGKLFLTHILANHPKKC